MANEFKVKKGLIVDGSNTVLDIQGTQGQLFSVTDSLTGDLFSVSDISGVPILNVNSSGIVTIDGSLQLADNDKIQIGNAQDLELYHDGSNSYIKDNGTGSFIINANGSNRFFVGSDVGVLAGTDFFIAQGRKLLLDGAGGHTYIEEESDSNLKFYVAGSERLNISNTNAIFAGNVTATKFKLNNNTNNTNADSFSVYDDGGSVSYGMTLWNTNATGGEWATMIFGPNQANRRISFGKANSNFGTNHAGIDELAFVDLDNGNFHIDGAFYGDGSNLTGVTVSNADTVDNLHASAFLQAGGSWNGANMPGSRYVGLAVNGGEVVFQRDNPNTSQMSILVDGAFYAGENNGFYSLYSSNSYNSKAGFYADTSGVLQFSAAGTFAGSITASGNITATGKAYDYDTIPPNQNLLDIGSIKIAGRDDIYGNATKTVITDYVAKYENDNTGATTIRIYVDDNILVDGDPYMVSVYYENLIGTLSVDFADTAITGNGSQTGTSSAPKSGRIYGHATRADYTSTFRFVDINLNQGSGHEVTLHSPKVEAGTTLTDFVATERTDMPTNSMHVKDLIATGGLKVIGPGSHNFIQSENDYTLGFNDSNGVSQWWIKNYTNGGFAIHENGVGDKFTIAAGGNATFAATVSATRFQGTTYPYNTTVGHTANATTTYIEAGSSSKTSIELSGGDVNSNIKFITPNASNVETLALTIDTSQNATFTGDIYVNDAIYLGAAGATGMVQAQANTGTNAAGGSLQLYGGGSTGTGVGGDIQFFVSPAGSSGTSANAWASALHIEGSDKSATFTGEVTATEYNLPSGGMLDWANGDARIVEGLVSNFSLSLQTYDGTNVTTALRLDGDNTATFAGSLSVSGKAIFGGVAARSTYGVTAGYSSSTAFVEDSDATDTNRNISIVNEANNSTNSYATLGFRISPTTTTSMGDLKFVRTGADENSLIWCTKHGSAFYDRLTIKSDGNVAVKGTGVAVGGTVLDVQGSQGQLFSVTNSLTGDLFSVADISGVPIFNVNSSGEIDVDGNINLGYADKINFGTSGSGLEIYSDSGSNSYIKETGGSGSLVFNSNSFYFQDNATTTLFRIVDGGGLQIYKASDPYIQFYEGTTNRGDIFVDTSLDTMVLRAAAGHGVQIKSNGNTDASEEGIYLATNDRVGIGTKSPSAQLHLYNAAAGGLPMLQVMSHATAAGSFTGNYMAEFCHAFSGVNHAMLIKNKETDNARRTLDIADGNGIFATFTNAKLGIGTTSPTTKLSVTDGASMYANSNYLVQIKRNATNGNDDTSKASILLANNSNAMQIAYGGTTDRLRFIDGGAVERFTMLNGGNVGIGATDPSTKLHVEGTTLIRTSGGVADLYLGNNATGNYARFHTNNSNTYFDMNCGVVYWRQGNGTRFQHNMTSGTFTSSGDIIAYGSPSDVRLKENIKPIESALDKAMKLQGVTFDWKKSDSILDIKEDIGFIAQDVKEVVPELVRKNEDGMLSMRHQGIAPILLEAIKELKAEIEELKKQIK